MYYILIVCLLNMFSGVLSEFTMLSSSKGAVTSSITPKCKNLRLKTSKGQAHSKEKDVKGSFRGQLTAETINALPLSMLWPLPNSMTLLNEEPREVQLVFPLRVKVYLEDTEAKSEVFQDFELLQDSLLYRVIKRYQILMREDFERAAVDFGFPSMSEALLVNDYPAYPTLHRLDIYMKSMTEVLSLTTDESYRLEIIEESLEGGHWKCKVQVGSVFGLMKAFETLTQLGGLRVIQGQLIRILDRCPLSIEDSPRFPHRGFMLDTSRHFFSVAIIKRMLEGMSASKLNVFHWHIVDGQSFPLLFDTLPELAQMGAYSNKEIYRVKDILEIIEFAKDRGIRVIPEFDMPGHTHSWGLAYPELVVCKNVQAWSLYSAAPPSGYLLFFRHY